MWHCVMAHRAQQLATREVHLADSNEAGAASGFHTLAEILFYLPTPLLRAQLEATRLDHERRCRPPSYPDAMDVPLSKGPTDFAASYTSRLPPSRQRWLLENDPEKWFAGLPAFAREFLTVKANQAHNGGDPLARSDSLAWIVRFIGEGVGHAAPPDVVLAEELARRKSLRPSPSSRDR